MTRPNVLSLAPGVGATIYGHLPRDIGEAVCRASDFVTLHTLADATDVASADRVRNYGCSRVWLGLPANYFVRLAATKGLAAAAAEARRCARVAVDAGMEVVEFNGEGQSDGKKPNDWIPDGPAEAATLARLSETIIASTGDELDRRGSGAVVLWTSHDMPSFRLPWKPILHGIGGHSPQHYPAQKGRTVFQRELMSRVARSQGRWEAAAERDGLPPAMLPGGDLWVPYYQGHGHDPGALVWGLAEARIARLWAYPGSWDARGLEALQLARALRVAAGWGPEAVERWQGARGLVADGMVGPKTLAALRALGLAPC